MSRGGPRIDPQPPSRYRGSPHRAPEVFAKHGPLRNMAEIYVCSGWMLFLEWFKHEQKKYGGLVVGFFWDRIFIFGWFGECVRALNKD